MKTSKWIWQELGREKTILTFPIHIIKWHAYPSRFRLKNIFLALRFKNQWFWALGQAHIFSCQLIDISCQKNFTVWCFSSKRDDPSLFMTCSRGFAWLGLARVQNFKESNNELNRKETPDKVINNKYDGLDDAIDFDQIIRSCDYEFYLNSLIPLKEKLKVP